MWSQWSLFSPRQFGPSTCELWQQELSTDSWLIDGIWFLALVAEPRTSKRLLRCNYDTTPPLNTNPVDTYCVDSGCTWSVKHRERIMLSYSLGGTGQKLKSICKFWGTEHTKASTCLIWFIIVLFIFSVRSFLELQTKRPLIMKPNAQNLSSDLHIGVKGTDFYRNRHEAPMWSCPSLGTPKVTTI